MPDPAVRSTPKGQPKGERQAQEQFLAQTSPPRSVPSHPVGNDIPPENPELNDPDFGDLSEMLFAPSQTTQQVPMPTRAADLGPNPAVYQMLKDPRLSEEFKGMIQLAVLRNILTRSKRID